MSIPKGDRWIQVEWNSGGRSVVNVRYLLKSLPTGEELMVGTVVTIGKREDGAPLTATVLASARERHQLQQQFYEGETGERSAAGTSAQKEDRDYSPSASDWEPSDESASEESEEEEEDSKKMKLNRSKIRQYPSKTVGRKVLTPTHRPNAIIPNGMQQLAFQNLMRNRKKAQNDTKHGARMPPDSTKKTKNNAKGLGVHEELINSMKAMFQELFKILSEVKLSFNVSDITEQNTTQAYDFQTDHSTNVSEFVDNENGEVDERSASEYSNRSDDNVLITNKYDTVSKNKEKAGNSEWVPIGSGTTLIHKDKFRKVNWKSYTIATRTLLLAAFSRRTLATHSLTGKKSPAFTNKPAKMCLDPKIVSDIVIEITDKFKVKENLVRSIITTKCADECKMQKMKINKKNLSKNAKNQENMPPIVTKTTNK